MKTRAREHHHDGSSTDDIGAVAPGRGTRTQRHTARVDAATQQAQHAILDAAWGAPVQLARDAHSGLDDHDVQAAAAHGIAGSGGALPHLDAIQRAFGHHDVSGVSAHVGGAAREASDAMGAHAYATGNDVAFADQPSLFLAAHEAAHVVQQRGGVQLSSAVGEAGDRYEQHADAVAARVVAGQSAADLLDEMVGGAGVQRAVVQRDEAPRPTTKPDAKPDATAGDRVATSWHVDFWGVGNERGVAGRGERKDGDVLVLDDLRIGPSKAPKYFKHAGNALSSGKAKLGDYDHPKGSGTASGLASYAKQSEVDVQLTWEGQKKGETNASALAAAKKTVEKMIHDHLGSSADWDAVEAAAAAEAKKHFTDPDAEVHVALKWKGGHQRHPLESVDYQVVEPSTCTVKVTVPTTTTTAPWTMKQKVIKKKVEDTSKSESKEGAVEVEAGGSQQNKQSNQNSNQKHDNTQTTTVDKTHKTTRTEREFGISLDKIDETTTHVFSVIYNSFSSMFERVTPMLEREEEAKPVEAPAKEEPGIFGKAWNAVKSVGKKAIDWGVGKVVGAAKTVAKVAANKWIRKALKRSGGVWTWIVGTAVEYGIDWVGDKIKGKLKLDKEKDTDKNPETDPKVPHQGPVWPIEQIGFESKWSAEFKTVDSTVRNQTKLDMRRAFEEFEQHDKTTVTNTDKGSGHQDGHQDESGSQSGARVKVNGSGSKSEREDNLSVDGTETEREYHGTTVKVTAGVPYLGVTVKQEGS